MSKTNDISKLACTTQDRELRDDELALRALAENELAHVYAVSGGMLMLSTVQLRDLLPFGGGGGSRGACKEQLSAQAA